MAPLVTNFNQFLLVFSNIWTYLNQQILSFLNYAFPIISFRADRGLRWVGQTFLAALLVAAAVYVVDGTFKFFGRLVNEILK